MKLAIAAVAALLAGRSGLRRRTGPPRRRPGLRQPGAAEQPSRPGDVGGGPSVGVHRAQGRPEIADRRFQGFDQAAAEARAAAGRIRSRTGASRCRHRAGDAPVAARCRCPPPRQLQPRPGCGHRPGCRVPPLSRRGPSRPPSRRRPSSPFRHRRVAPAVAEPLRRCASADRARCTRTRAAESAVSRAPETPAPAPTPAKPQRIFPVLPDTLLAADRPCSPRRQRSPLPAVVDRARRIARTRAALSLEPAARPLDRVDPQSAAWRWPARPWRSAARLDHSRRAVAKTIALSATAPRQARFGGRPGPRRGCATMKRSAG